MPNLSDYFLSPQSGFHERLPPAAGNIEDRRRRPGTLPGSSQIPAPEMPNEWKHAGYLTEQIPLPDLSGFKRLPEDAGIWDIGRKRQDRLVPSVGN